MASKMATNTTLQHIWTPNRHISINVGSISTYFGSTNLFMPPKTPQYSISGNLIHFINMPLLPISNMTNYRQAELVQSTNDFGWTKMLTRHSHLKWDRWWHITPQNMPHRNTPIGKPRFRLKSKMADIMGSNIQMDLILEPGNIETYFRCHFQLTLGCPFV